MDLTKVLRILSTNAKAATIAGIAVAATAGGGAAVVATTVADSSPTTTVTTSNTTGHGDATETPDVKDSESPDAQESKDATETPDSQSTQDAAKTVTPVDCGTTAWANHGAFVKSVAQASPSASSSPGDHGAAVSAAAQSDCGKPTPGASHSPNANSTASHSPNAHASAGQANKAATHGKSAGHRHNH